MLVGISIILVFLYSLVAMSSRTERLDIMKMASMWYAINHSDIEKSMKQVIFVGINIVLWAAIAFIVCVAGGAIGGSFNEKWRFMTFLITGYSAVIMGFFRSVFYLLRK